MGTSDIRGSKAGPLAWFLVMMAGLILLGFLKDIYQDDFPMGEELYLMDFVLTFQVNLDSWYPMYRAAVEKMTNPDAGLYQTIFFDQNIKFQYPPASLLPIMGLVNSGVTWEDFLSIMNITSFISMIAISWCVYRIAIVTFRSYYQHGEFSWGLRFVLFILMLIGTLTFYPIIHAQYLGQIQVILDLVIALSFLLWLEERKIAAGVMIALATIVKPQFGLLLLWAVLRKEKHFALGMFAVLAVVGIVSLIVFGFQDHIDYLAVLSYIGKHGEVFWPNQSINGILNRLLSDVSSLEWDFYAYAPYNSFVYAGTLASTIGFLLFGLFYRPAWVRNDPGNKDPMISLLDMATMVLLLTIASPVAWEHHYGVAWPVVIVLLALIVILLRTDKTLPSVLSLVFGIVGCFLVANFFPYAEEVAYSTPPINILQSYIFFGGLLLIAALLLLRVRARPLLQP
ncbi:MAG: hypothetical protein CMN55_01090 [Sneathiella sp.]|jgi:hypothetical protein|uniref:glycosyltransferase family 87 protein n=1 Tax=Sneathiella sp. TaxID=1964365 RepID=UPI000C390025|nr:glycosyltransferase family 87 protein [Sneathiella sp.]MAL77703.1 hypothetical protein [Sneathiella sp.]|tara:strand:+ start:543 stop:1904 length:1362 start_codon:yes stop_codon:yes gene_type:complete